MQKKNITRAADRRDGGEFFAMSADEYRTALDKLGFAGSIEGKRAAANDAGFSAAARFFGVSPRAGQAWASAGPPNAVAVALRLMLALDITFATAVAALARKRR